MHYGFSGMTIEVLENLQLTKLKRTSPNNSPLFLLLEQPYSLVRKDILQLFSNETLSLLWYYLK